MQCPNCQEDNVEGARFCTACGAVLRPAIQICPTCHTENTANANFCVDCGTSLRAGTAEARVADAVGTATAAATARPAIIPPPGPAKIAGAPAARPGTKMAAICVWLVSALLGLLAFTAFGPSAAEIQDCIAAGGSGMTCPISHFPAPLFWVLAVIGVGYGGKLWVAKK